MVNNYLCLRAIPPSETWLRKPLRQDSQGGRAHNSPKAAVYTSVYVDAAPRVTVYRYEYM